MPKSSRPSAGPAAKLAASTARRHAEPEIAPPPRVDPAGGRFQWARWYKAQVARLVEVGVDGAEAKRQVQAVAKEALRRDRTPLPAMVCAGCLGQLGPDEPAVPFDGGVVHAAKTGCRSSADYRRVQQEIRELLARDIVPVEENR